MPNTNYQCKFCNTRFVHEDRFLRHHCKQMKRDEEFRSVLGQQAWVFYQNWMKAHRRMVPAAKSFIHSKYFNSFVKFASFANKVHLPDTGAFIWLMKDKDILPTIWTNDQVYSMYLEFMDRKVAPKRHAEITINTLFDLSDEHQCEVSDVFNHLTPNEVIMLLRGRRISPWLLLKSDKFKEFFLNATSQEEKIIMETIIRPDYWSKKFAANPDAIKSMLLYVAELKL